MEYPFECFASILGLLLGITLILGSIRPESLFTLLPPLALLAYAVGSLAGAGTIFAGLVTRHKNPVLMAVGLRLIALLIGLYGVGVIAYSGWAQGGMAAIFFIGIALLAAFRSIYLRTNAEVSLREHRGG